MTKNRKITRILIANRAEIASRVARTAKKLGITTIGIASEPDKTLPYTGHVDEIVLIPGSAPSETYLNQNAILEIAKKHKVDAIHPGYGFLSENPEFAKAVEDAGIIFIGPSSDAIKTLGSKTESRLLAEKLKVPLTKGAPGGLSDAELVKLAKDVGYPVLIKAAAGGGGRGMRIAHSDSELASQLPQARAEAKKFFSNDNIYFEQYIPTPRHVEVQLFGDGNGEVIHLRTRDCSVQRRYQKLIEEAPAPFLSKDLEDRICNAAVTLAKAVKYRSAGTAEFLVYGDSFYFLEVNTRLQVEHPVTEEITGLDLVALQIQIAEGKPLLKQSEVKFSGHAVEFRINAEDPLQNFLPTAGKISKLSTVNLKARFDGGYVSGCEIPQQYDNLIGKLIVKGASRDDALTKSAQELGELIVEGVPTTIPLFRWMLFATDWGSEAKPLPFLTQTFTEERKKELSAFMKRDDSWKRSDVGEFVESVRVNNKIVDIIHERGGTFLAIDRNDSTKKIRSTLRAELLT